MISISKDKSAIEKIKSFICEEDVFDCDFYVTLWNYTKRKAEYVPLKGLDHKERVEHMIAAISLPIFNKGIRINDDLYYDGAFLDNIPVLPLVDKNLDFIFNIYFDGRLYEFENSNFDRKIIKLNNFPEKSGCDFIVYDPSKIDKMISYGYEYTKNTIERLFVSPKYEDVYKKISDGNVGTKNRITTEVLLTQINKVMSGLSKRKNI